MFFIKSKKRLLLCMYANLAVGLLLVATGIFLEITGFPFADNNKSLIGLAFIPLGLSTGAFLNLIFIKKYPDGMKPVLISENDERLTAIKNKADALTFRFLRWVLMLVFFGYTFIKPNDIFETVSWWIMFAFYFISYMLQGTIMFIFSKNNYNEQ